MDASDLYWKPRKNFLLHFSKEKPYVCLYFFLYFTCLSGWLLLWGLQEKLTFSQLEVNQNFMTNENRWVQTTAEEEDE